MQHAQDVAQHRVCPYCGGALVLRTAKKSGKQFWACSAYPCRYTARNWLG